MTWLSTIRTSWRRDTGRPDQSRFSGEGNVVGFGRGGDAASLGVGHDGSPRSSPRRAWHHCASWSSAAALILGGPPPVIQAVA
jgi:hypothetical protein